MNTRKKNWRGLPSAITAWALLLCFMATACRSPMDFDSGGPGYDPDRSVKPDTVLLDMRANEDSEWDFLLTGKNWPPTLFNVDKDGLPTDLYFHPVKDNEGNQNDVGLFLTFNEEGQPDTMFWNDFTIYFFNYDGYSFDVAVVAPNGDVEYHYGVETDTNWGALGGLLAPEGPPDLSLSMGRSASARSLGDFFKKNKLETDIALELLDKGLAAATCIGALFIPVFWVGCGIAVASAIVELGVVALENNGAIGEGAAGAAGYVVDGANLIVDGLGCAKITTDPIGGAIDCAGTFIGASKIASSMADDLGLLDAVDGFIEKAVETIDGAVAKGKETYNKLVKPKETPKDTPVASRNHFVSFNANGGSGTAPAEKTVANGGYVTLPPTTLTRTGYKFAGWSETGEPTPYNGEYPKQITRNTTFYARWSSTRPDEPSITWTATADSITLTWVKVSGVNRYSIYRRDFDSNGQLGSRKLVGTAYPADSPSYTDTGLTEDTRYYYEVTAHSSSTGESGAVGVYARTNPIKIIIPLEEMIYVPGGSFEMGKNGDGTSGNVTPVHTVTLSGFYIGKYEVTQKQWQAVMGRTQQQQQALQTDYTSNYGRSDDRPIYLVNWYEALVFCNKLSMSEGLSPAYRISNSANPDDWGTVPTASNSPNIATWNAAVIVSGSTGYRLPTEAQWEYAAKGGNGTPGNYLYAGSDTIGDVAWYSGNNGSSGTATYANKQVGKKAPNGLGIYDMSGNVFEWCWDWPAGYTSAAQTDPQGASSGSERVYRGGSWGRPEDSARSTYRGFMSPYRREITIGFRIVRPAE